MSEKLRGIFVAKKVNIISFQHLIVALSLLWAGTALSKGAIIIGPETESIYIDSAEYYTTQFKGTLTPQEVEQNPHLREKKPALSAFGYVSQGVWIKLIIHNQSNHSVWNLSTLRTEVREFKAYQKSPGASSLTPGKKLSTHLTGSQLSLKPGPNEVFVFLKSPIQKTIFFSLTIPSQNLYLNTLSAFISFLFLGVALVLIFYNLALLAVFKEITYFLYTIFGISMILAHVAYVGLCYRLNMPELGSFLDDTGLLWMALPAPLGLAYTRRFLFHKSSHTHINRAIYTLLTADVGFVLATLQFSPQELGPIYEIILAINIATVISASIYMYRKTPDAAHFCFLLGWGLFLSAVVYWGLGTKGWIPQNMVNIYAPLFGNTMELVFSAVALSIHIGVINRDHLNFEIKNAETESLHTLVQVVCHDIANPLTVIQSLLKSSNGEEPIPPKMRTKWSKISRAADQVADIIHSVRRMEEAILGIYEVDMEWTDLNEVLEEVKFVMAKRAKKKQIDLVINEAPPGTQVLCERVPIIHNVLNNFVSNAIKFSHRESSIVISAFHQNYEAIIEITDYGIGMEAKQVENLFQRYQNKTHRGTNQEKGSGFGMPLAHYFINQYGGRVEVVSRSREFAPDNHGTTFKIILPSTPTSQEKLVS